MQSVSRLGVKVSGPKSQEAAGYIRRMMAVYRDAEDLINVGAYVQGSNPEIDEAIEKIPQIRKFLVQAIEEKASLEDTFSIAESISEITIPEEEKQNEAVSLQA